MTRKCAEVTGVMLDAVTAKGMLEVLQLTVGCQTELEARATTATSHRILSKSCESLITGRKKRCWKRAMRRNYQNLLQRAAFTGVHALAARIMLEATRWHGGMFWSWPMFIFSLLHRRWTASTRAQGRHSSMQRSWFRRSRTEVLVTSGAQQLHFRFSL